MSSLVVLLVRDVTSARFGSGCGSVTPRPVSCEDRKNAMSGWEAPETKIACWRVATSTWEPIRTVAAAADWAKANGRRPVGDGEAHSRSCGLESTHTERRR
ncbi:hypothetical protein PF005_g26982 [Phytophthora fragariae]|uniref:Uncharacterized protein n=4 Tax=Phytophthora TaxID=4783 RepID=A0A6A3DJ66_9STRA|nr:hypothetical protein PF003_g34755 [Phytophthora fragariae]KAE8979155.1 hypothetical protein PR002_g24498 [Phytophthora rubi]KAE8921902.1 hypothetical protein PF009_g27825 [Phytophthora fragariae]KAE9069284.1 hypothetical protein PF010_g26723 [Phytophthora fragariae]KAE9171824.1 hypothetical protein PF005_g26982 [Phytophthora fragariae]